MKYEKCCRNCEYAYLTPRECKGCDTFGDNKYENFKLRDELAKIEKDTFVELPCKIGDTVYCVRYNRNYKLVMSKTKVTEFLIHNRLLVKCACDSAWYEPKDIFIGKEQAEARLAELKGEKI